MPAVAGDLHRLSGILTVLAAIFASRLAVTIASRMSTFGLLFVRHIHRPCSEPTPNAAQPFRVQKPPAVRCRPFQSLCSSADDRFPEANRP